MKSSAVVLSTFNDVLTTKLTSINRYFLHARMFKNWGFENLNDVSYKKSIKDMKQSDSLIERILMLEGLPNLQKLKALQIGETPEEMLSCDLHFQQAAVVQFKAAIATCETEQDYVSRGILDSILNDEEFHLDWLETQQHLIGATGIQNYLQSQIEEGE